MGAGEGNRRDERLLPSGRELLVRAVLAAIGGAGQGAHREVGSEGFEAKHRAVAEIGEPVGPIQVMPSLHYGGEGSTWGPGHNKVCAGGTVGKYTALPREISYGPARRGWVAGRISRRGEVVGDAVREVGVTRGTQEPRNNRSLGTVPVWGGGGR